MSAPKPRGGARGDDAAHDHGDHRVAGRDDARPSSPACCAAPWPTGMDPHTPLRAGRRNAPAPTARPPPARPRPWHVLRPGRGELTACPASRTVTRPRPGGAEVERWERKRVEWSEVGYSGARWRTRGPPARLRDHLDGSSGGGAVFLGTHSPRLDDKGRLFLPAKFRDELAEGVVITRGRSGASTCSRWPSSAGHRGDVAGAGHPRRRSGTTAGCSSPAPRTRCRTSRAGSPSRRRCASTPG